MPFFRYARLEKDTKMQKIKKPLNTFCFMHLKFCLTWYLELHTELTPYVCLLTESVDVSMSRSSSTVVKLHRAAASALNGIHSQDSSDQIISLMSVLSE